MLNFAQNLIDEFVFRVKRHKVQCIVACICFVCGLVLGVVLYKMPSAYYWQNNRFDFACVLAYEGFFTVSWRSLLGSALIVVCCVLSQMQPFLRSLLYVCVLLCVMYVAGTLCALFQISVALGVLYILLWCTICLFSDVCLLLWCVVAVPCENTLKEAIYTLKTAVYVYCGLFFARILVIFLLLRPIYGLI